MLTLRLPFRSGLMRVDQNVDNLNDKFTFWGGRLEHLIKIEMMPTLLSENMTEITSKDKSYGWKFKARPYVF
jgi:hypothetical protein